MRDNYGRIKMLCSKCREWQDNLKMKSGCLLCDECAKPSGVPHHVRAIIAELALQNGGPKWKRPDAKT